MKTTCVISRNIVVGVGLICIIGFISGSLGQAQISQQDVSTDEKQDVKTLYDLALKSFENREYISAESTLRQVLKEDSLFQEPSGRSAWTWLGLALEKREEPLSAVRTLEEGLNCLKSASLTDLYLQYDLARVIAENNIEDHETDLTALMVDVFQNISRERQPDLWQRIMDEMAFMLGKEDRERIEEALESPGGKPEQILHVFFRREDPNPITEENELFVKIFQRARTARECGWWRPSCS